MANNLSVSDTKFQLAHCTFCNEEITKPTFQGDEDQAENVMCNYCIEYFCKAPPENERHER